MKRYLVVLVGIAAAMVLGSQSVLASSIYATGSNGVDVNYPNCTTAIPSVDFGIVGVNRGVVFSQNECLSAEASHFQDLSLYLNTGLNSSPSSSNYIQAQAGCSTGDVDCAAYHYGYNAAQDALNYATSQGVSSSKWWLDVESSNTWTTDVNQNQESLLGAHDALVAAGATTVGVYSTTVQWNNVTGTWHNDWPSWGATTWTSAKQAAKYCTGHQFTGGPSLLMQYQSKRSNLDQDVAC